MKVNNGIYILIILPFLLSCGNSIPRREYVPWMENAEHGLRQIKTEGDVTYTLQYKTADYILEKSTPSADISDQIEQIRKEMENRLLFGLFITCPDGGPLQYKARDMQEINGRYHYYHFRFVEQVYLETETGHVKPTYCIADKGSGLNNTLSFNIGFEKTVSPGEDFRFVVDDKYLGTGTVKFLFKSKHLDRIPSIKTD